MGDALAPERLLAVIETQNEIAATELDLDQVMDRVAERARELIGAAAAVVELFDAGEMVYCAASGAASEHIGLRIDAGRSLSGLCVAEDRVLYCADAETDPRVDRKVCRQVGATSLLCVPLVSESVTVGVLKIYDPRANAFDESDAETLRLLSGLIGAHMAHATEFEEQGNASRHDALTGLPNRRDFDGRLASEAARARRHGDEMTICLMDLDGLRLVNDTFGRESGDAVLVSVARHLEALRGEDGAFRFGGDEFALVLIGTDEDGAMIVAERIADAVRADPAALGTTISWGVASLDGRDPVATMELAAEALHEAKAARARRSEGR
jgi:diguanylate cyclase (GGDEF)-like protein